jgi:hypothetical protein
VDDYVQITGKAVKAARAFLKVLYQNFNEEKSE